MFPYCASEIWFFANSGFIGEYWPISSKIRRRRIKSGAADLFFCDIRPRRVCLQNLPVKKGGAKYTEFFCNFYVFLRIGVWCTDRIDRRKSKENANGNKKDFVWKNNGENRQNRRCGDIQYDMDFRIRNVFRCIEKVKTERAEKRRKKTEFSRFFLFFSIDSVREFMYNYSICKYIYAYIKIYIITYNQSRFIEDKSTLKMRFACGRKRTTLWSCGGKSPRFDK